MKSDDNTVWEKIMQMMMPDDNVTELWKSDKYLSTEYFLQKNRILLHSVRMESNDNIVWEKTMQMIDDEYLIKVTFSFSYNKSIFMPFYHYNLLFIIT